MDKIFPYEQEILDKLKATFPSIEERWLLVIIRVIKHELCGDCVFLHSNLYD